MVAVTGLDRLRGYARRMDELHVWPGGAKLLEIAEQIERELEDERCSDVETVRSDAMEAWRWVREHGGLDYVKSEWRSRVPRDRYERRRQRLLGHIAECETALGRRREIISKLTHHVNAIANENVGLRRRAMPEGCEWPRFEDGAPVKFGDVVSDGDETGRVYYVTFDTVNPVIIGFTDETPDRDPGTWLEVSVSDGERVKRPAVLAGDGKPLREGQTVWGTKGGSYHLTSVHDGKVFARHVGGSFGAEVESAGGEGLYRLRADQLTHKRPDSWERIEEDADALVDAEINGEGSYNAANAYCNLRGLGDGTSFVLMAQDLVRRCRALAERERSE